MASSIPTAVMGVLLIPQNERTAFVAAICFPLSAHPRCYPEIFHILKFFDDRFMVGNAIDNMRVLEILQPFTGEHITLKATCDTMLFGTVTEAMFAVLAVRRQFV